LLTIGIRFVRSLEFSTSICLPQLRRINMSLDTKLILDAIGKLFDDFDARWERRLPKLLTAQEASPVISVLTPTVAVGATIIADNWGGGFNGGEYSIEQYCTAPSIVADNWGGFFGGEDAAANAEFAIDPPDDPERFVLPNASTNEPSIDPALARTNSRAADDSVNALVTSTDPDALLDAVPADALASFIRSAPFFHNEISGAVPALARLTCFARRDLAALHEFELPPTDNVIRACDINRRRPPREGPPPPALPLQPMSRLRGRAGRAARALLPRPRRLRDSLRPRQGRVQGLLVPQCRCRIWVYVVVGHRSPTIREAASRAHAVDDWLMKPLAQHRLLGRAYCEEDEVLNALPNRCLMNCFILIWSCFSPTLCWKIPWPPPFSLESLYTGDHALFIKEMAATDCLEHLNFVLNVLQARGEQVVSPGFGRPYVFNAEMLKRVKRTSEAKDSARVAWLQLRRGC
jgi:hypothetical protein